MAFALAAAEIDLSVGSVAALSSLVAAEAVGSYGFAAACIGLANGLITVKVRIPSFLVTLGMLGIVSGIARNMNNLQSLPIRNDTFLAVFGAGSAGPISSLLIWTAVAGLIGHLVLHQLRWGRHVLSVGADRAAAGALGINTARIRITALMTSAAAASFAGVLLAGRLAIGRHDLGENLPHGHRGSGHRRHQPVRWPGLGSRRHSGVGGDGHARPDPDGPAGRRQLIARGAIIILAVALSMREQKET